MLELARQHGHKDMVNKLTPKKDLKTIKRELIVSIRHGKTDQDLWNSYCEAIKLQQLLRSLFNFSLQKTRKQKLPSGFLFCK